MNLRHALIAATLALAAAASPAVPVTDPRIEMSIWGILPSDPTGPGQLLNVATQDVAVNGEILIREDLGTQGLGIPSSVSAFASEDGKTFWVYASTPNNYRSAVEYIGSRAELRIEHTYRKDDPNATLSYTHNLVNMLAYVNPEFGPGCRRLGPQDCLQAQLTSLVEVRDSQGRLVWLDTNGANVTSVFGNTAYEPFLVGTWPWTVDDQVRPVFVDMRIGVVGDSVTRMVDLSAIDLLDTFTVSFLLESWAIDISSDVGPARGAISTSRDPLSGNTGATTLDWTGLTPIVASPNPTVPAPGSLTLVLPALFALLGVRAARLPRRRALPA